VACESVTPSRAPPPAIPHDNHSESVVDWTAPVSETSHNTLRKILAFAAVVEVGTGLVLMIDPAIVVTLLLGVEVSGAGTPIALLALGLACWPSRQRVERGSPPFRAMLIYNLLIALYLAYLGTVRHLGGSLLWLGVALHAVVALLLVWTGRDQRRTEATNV
jgi:Ca2+/Na+ antiporter